MPLEVSPAPFQMQLPYAPRFVPETLPPGAAGGAGPEAAGGSSIIPPNPGAVASPHRAIPALSDAGYTAPNIRAVTLVDALQGGDVGPYGPMSAGGSMYGGGRPTITAPFPAYPVMGQAPPRALSNIQTDGWESASLPAPRRPRLSTRIEPSHHHHRSHDHADDASDASYYARPRVSRHRSASSASSYDDQIPKEHHRTSGSVGHHQHKSGHLESSRSPYAQSVGGDHSSSPPSPLAGHAGDELHHHVRSPLSPTRARDNRHKVSDGDETDGDARERRHSAARYDAPREHDGRHGAPAPKAERRGWQSSRKADYSSDTEEDRGRRYSQHGGMDTFPGGKNHRYHSHRRDRGYESDQAESRSQHGDRKDPRGEQPLHLAASQHFPISHLELPDMDSLSLHEHRPRAHSHSRSSSDGGRHHHLHHHNAPQHRHEHHSYTHRPPSPSEVHPHAARDPYRRRALSMQFDSLLAMTPHAALGAGYQTPGVAGVGNVDMHDDGASVAGSGMTFMDGPIAGRTSLYGLPKYAHHMKPDYRRFCVQRGTADVYLD